MRRACLLLLLLAVTVAAKAQYAADTLSRPSFRASQLIAPGLLLGAGTGVHYFGHQALEVPFRDYVQTDLREGIQLPFVDAGSYVQYIPSSLHLGLGLLGCNARKPFTDRFIESSIAHLAALCLSRVPKHLLHNLRPDGSDYKSFPSGHATLSFTGAELTRMDYGAWWGAGTYALSAFVAAERIYGDRHWLGDVLAGAGVGILSAHIGEWLLEPVKSLFGIPDCSWDGLGGRRVQLSLAPCIDPATSYYTASFSVVF